MTDPVLDQIRDLIQEDVGGRGLRTDPAENLITTCPLDFHRACLSVADTSRPGVVIVTGFFIPHAQPPCAETDGPLGALFLARALTTLGIPVTLLTDAFCYPALWVGVVASGLRHEVLVAQIPSTAHNWKTLEKVYQRHVLEGFLPGTPPRNTHLIALERVGPSHTVESIRAQPQGKPGTAERFALDVPENHWGRCHTMRGRDITDEMGPAHLFFDAAPQAKPQLTTIGIGDGGNEIGMGKIAWDVIRRNIPNGGLIACRVPTDYLIVSGVSNWGAYGLAAGVRYLRNAPWDAELFDPARELQLLETMVKEGPLVDGVSGQPTATVDGLSFERYSEPLVRIGALLR
jgi:hypothetical protein